MGPQMHNFLCTEKPKYKRYYIEKQTVSSGQKGRVFPLLPHLCQTVGLCWRQLSGWQDISSPINNSASVTKQVFNLMSQLIYLHANEHACRYLYISLVISKASSKVEDFTMLLISFLNSKNWFQ